MPAQPTGPRPDQPSQRDLSPAELHYLQGAELAQAGQYAHAQREMIKALELQPTLHTARLQLGLLQLTLAQPVQALSTWEPLDQLDDADPLKRFKQGLEALIRDDFMRCIQLLESGIAANTNNPALNRDMQLVISRARARSASAAANTAAQAQESQAKPAVHTDFSLYDQ